MSRDTGASPDQRASPLAIWSALAAVYVIWGSTYLAIRFTVETTPPFLSAAARFIISGGFLYLWRRLAGDPRPTGEEWRNASIIGIFLLVGGNGGVVWAAQFIPSSLAALLVATVIGCPTDQQHRAAKADQYADEGSSPRPIAMTKSVEQNHPERQASVEHLHGAIAVLVASCLWAIGSIYGKTAKLPASPLVTTGVEMLVGGTVLIFVAYIFGEFANFEWAAISPRSASAWTYLTVIGPVAFVAYAWLLRVAPIPLVATYSYVNPLVAILLGYFLGNEILTPRILLAAGLIIGSVVLVSAPKR